MHIGIQIQPKLKTEQSIAPHIIQSIEVLALPVLELHNFVQNQLQENPVLEQKENFAEEDKQSEPEREREREEKSEQSDDDFLSSFENLESEDFREYFAENHIPKRFDEKDKKFEAIKNTASPQNSLQDHLYEQLHFFELSEHLLNICKHIIYNIDGNGYLRYSLEEVTQPMDGEVTMEEAEVALHYVQKLEPTGVGARNMKECLLLQLEVEDNDYLFKKNLIENHLEDICNNKYPKIVKETGRSLEDIKNTVGSLQKLNPKPGGNISSENAHFIIPDVVVTKEGDEYIVHLEEKYVPQLRINNTYRKLLREKNSQAKEFVKKKMESANWIIDAIRQRQQTLRLVIEEIVEHQHDFLEYGLSHLRPLKMKDLAEKLDVSISTISRAMSEKYIQTPRGIFPLKFFCTGSISKNDGENESRVSVQERIQQIINQEDKRKPLSDVDISKKLKEVGLDIARRTVTKYREFLKIPSSRRRKVY
ncbi:RNA polymerase factor sigma-54 [Candidatus Uabimicrobium sp. HlEnr_7]|uniref:RNA polymerase factor sigma-54 n=1 Tax=Candidatus Uabimicrobium helgolandensis TaxID=3095367 RepID=UPI003557B7BF